MLCSCWQAALLGLLLLLPVPAIPLLLLACTEFCGRSDAVQTVQLYACLFSTKQKQTGNSPAAAAQGSPFFALKSACEALFE
jgi:hypothetical protein